MVEMGSNTTRELLDYELLRYGCYLIVQNGDPRKEVKRLKDKKTKLMLDE